MTKNTIDIAIVGGGLLGMMSAYYLSEAGLKVALFDKSKLAGESSWAGGGILTPLYPWRYDDAINDLAFRSQKLYPSLVADLHEISNIDPQYVNSGMLISQLDIDSYASQWLMNNNVNFRSTLDSEFCNVSGEDEYFLLPDICQVRNPCLAASLKSTLHNKSVVIHEYCGVNHINPISSDQIELITEQGKFSAAKVIVSAGAWSGKILSQLGTSVPVKPVRGQMLLFKAPVGLISSIILAEGKYIIPRVDGHVLVGSTMEDVGFNKCTTQQAYDSLMKFVKVRCPILAKSPIVKHWSGLRPASPKGIPFIFQHPEHKALYVNSGHFRNGVVLAPASAELVRDLILGSQSMLNPQAYAYEHLVSDSQRYSDSMLSIS